MKTWKQDAIFFFLAVLVIAITFVTCKQPAGSPQHTHIWGEWEVTTPATCIATGVETRTCTLDPTHTETRTIPIDPNAHQWGDIVVHNQPTCTETGDESATCQLCGIHDDHVTIPALGHDYQNYTTKIAPTCTEAGEEEGTCTHDSSHKDARVVVALGHDFGDWIQTTAPTELAEGEETRTCKHDSEHKETHPFARLPITTAANLTTYLASQPENDIDTPYIVVMNVSNLTDVRTAITNSGKYVSLDLSGSTFTSIGNSAFSGCSSLTSITIPASVTNIDHYAFNNCRNLAGITIPDGVIHIGVDAFSQCSLTNITIPASVTTIERGAFGGKSFVSVTFEGIIAEVDFDSDAFHNLGDLRDKYLAKDGGVGTYIVTEWVEYGQMLWGYPLVWEKQ